MARRKQLATGAGWFSSARAAAKKLAHKAKKHIVKHVKKHAKHAWRHAKKAGKAAAKQAKSAAIAAGKELLEQAKEEAKSMLAETINDATEAATAHVRKHVCSKVGAGFFNAQKAMLHKLAHKEMEAVHRKGMAHVRSGGKKGGALDAHVNKAKDRVEKSVERIKNSAKSRIRQVAGCDEEGEGFSTRGAGFRSSMLQGQFAKARRAAAKKKGSGFSSRMLQAKFAKAKKAAAKKKGAGLRMRGAGYKKKCTCH